MNILQSTINSVRFEMKLNREMTLNEQFSLISIPNIIKTIIKNNLKLARHGRNKIRLDIPENSILKICKLKYQSFELVVMNILILNLKNMINGLIGIKLSKDDHDQIISDNTNLISVGSERNLNLDYFVLTVTNSSNIMHIEQQTLMDVFTFNTFIHLCSQSNIILKYNYSFD